MMEVCTPMSALLLVQYIIAELNTSVYTHTVSFLCFCCFRLEMHACIVVLSMDYWLLIH